MITDDALWQTELFASSTIAPPDPCTVSAAAAYQDALYGRAVLLDLRTDAERARDGVLDPRLPVCEVRDGVDLADLRDVARLHLITAGAPVVEPATIAGFDPNDPEISYVRGGFPAWAAAGLPIR